MFRLFVLVMMICRAFCPTALEAQTTTTDYRSGLHLSLRGGWDVPSYLGFSPYIQYKPGFSAGVSADYYWKWFGLGADFDYMANASRSIYPTDDLYLLMTEPFENFYLEENRIERFFLGGGFSLKLQPTNNFSTELKIRGGVSSISGGYTLLMGAPFGYDLEPLNFHAGFEQADNEVVPAGKVQLELKYFFSEMVGFNLGAYYLSQFSVPEAYDPPSGIYSGYYPVTTAGGVNSIETDFIPAFSPCNCDYSSWGVTAGITVRIPESRRKPRDVPQTGNIRVTARDVQTGQLLPNTQVALKNAAGAEVGRGVTDANGDVYFLEMPFDNYFIEGTLYDKRLKGNAVRRTEFSSTRRQVEKEILYDDPNFILQGQVVKCNTNTSLPRVSVVLKNLEGASEKRTITNGNGEYIFHLNGRSDYQIYANKDMHLSLIEHLSTRGYDRNATLFINLEICMEPLGCGDIYHVYYDYNDTIINREGKRELDVVAQFLRDNPGLKAEIQGHTDARGTEDYNKKLSIRRANSAKQYLTEQGIAYGRLSVQGFGEQYPLEKCNPSCKVDEDHHHYRTNRRTDVKIICKN
ncbi:MAG: OmpA family protein [Saprospiraceae bacterium]|jgi:hypothetical protein|nr:OmpA family protein [Saprospiraceae bacterium]